METAFHSLGICVDIVTDLSELDEFCGTEMVELTVAGYPAATDGPALWIHTDRGVLGILPGAIITGHVDPVTCATAVAEMVAPRWVEQS